jgi:hypothetical protein
LKVNPWHGRKRERHGRCWPLESYGLRWSPACGADIPPCERRWAQNLVYFMLSHKRQVDDDDEDETWVIMVDTLSKTLRTSFRYMDDSTNRLPCEFSKYLHAWLHVPKTPKTS